jgi:hypothetical protein
MATARRRRSHDYMVVRAASAGCGACGTAWHELGESTPANAGRFAPGSTHTATWIEEQS